MLVMAAVPISNPNNRPPTMATNNTSIVKPFNPLTCTFGLFSLHSLLMPSPLTPTHIGTWHCDFPWTRGESGKPIVLFISLQVYFVMRLLRLHLWLFADSFSSVPAKSALFPPGPLLQEATRCRNGRRIGPSPHQVRAVGGRDEAYDTRFYPLTF
mmetsp:Transcript_7934/g.12824  ORF Transcript_7934/g.12824 Transcript_7934/m.12824 type:complete len:155 (+) Transcript_7934:395-859(+)